MRGRRKGCKNTAEHNARIAESQRKRWEALKAAGRGDELSQTFSLAARLKWQRLQAALEALRKLGL